MEYMFFFFIHMSHEGNTKYKEGKGRFEHVTHRSKHLNLNHWAKTSLVKYM